MDKGNIIKTSKFLCKGEVQDDTNEKLAALGVAAVMAIAPLVSAIPAQAKLQDVEKRIPDEFPLLETTYNSQGGVSGMYGMDSVRAYYQEESDTYVISMHQTNENRNVILLQSESGEFDDREEAEDYVFYIEVSDLSAEIPAKFTSTANEAAGKAPSNIMTLTFRENPDGYEYYSLGVLSDDPTINFATLSVYKEGGKIIDISLAIEATIESGIDYLQAPDGTEVFWGAASDGETYTVYGLTIYAADDEEAEIDYIAESYVMKDNGKWYELCVDFDNLYITEIDVPQQEKLSDIFKDCKDNEWYSPYVMSAYQLGLMTGKSEGVFAPTEKLSRAQFAQILWRMGGSQIEAPTINFPDNKKGAWYYDAVNWATNHGIITGYTSGANAGKFCPASEITREQIAAMLYRFANNYHQIDTSARADLSKYQDAGRISAFAKDALSWANATGLITGKNETTLAPQGKASRCECATIIVRYIDTFMGKG